MYKSIELDSAILNPLMYHLIVLVDIDGRVIDMRLSMRPETKKGNDGEYEMKIGTFMTYDQATSFYVPWKAALNDGAMFIKQLSGKMVLVATHFPEPIGL